MEYDIVIYVGVGLITLYVAMRLASQRAINKLVQSEYEHVLNHDEHKVKGRFG